MKKDLYEAIFKRKSFHLFRGVGSDVMAQDELENIEKAYADFDRLYPGIRPAIRIVPASKVNFKRDAEFCILIYSEEKENYLMNAGYRGAVGSVSGTARDRKPVVRDRQAGYAGLRRHEICDHDRNPQGE